MGRWGDGEMGEIFIKGNYPDMILESMEETPAVKPTPNRFEPIIHQKGRGGRGRG
ncbi:MAG: hypothetical protein F6K26_29040 [Moorea sp. SIO2I5]|nr:hypothetical protein [Moorena sp. SIO2I5]